MSHFFNIDTIFFTVLGYPMSYLEFFGTVFGALAVWLSVRANVWSWPAGVVSVSLFFFIFYQIQLYPDMFLQIFFLITNLIGWWRWKNPARGEEDRHNELRVTRLSTQHFMLTVLGSLVATVVFGAIAGRLHEWFPVLFNKPSAFPYLDSFTSVLSIVATYLLIQKKVETWYVWLVVDAISAYMYFVKGVKLIGIEYAVYCLVALVGVYHFTQEYRRYSGVAA
ncbi:nicotinamide riboside transporter PnuC [Tellurirhabdus rosea]|uniref:nicotinamide riboside transporter PnuC n=1 Tax=Tellurirhabdus rosea TaxID=2674997 RepID=UPI0022576405|nr:nicotinamide riboside transporter PnuC [Tellurirhabdus rosea]